MKLHRIAMCEWIEVFLTVIVNLDFQKPMCFTTGNQSGMIEKPIRDAREPFRSEGPVAEASWWNEQVHCFSRYSFTDNSTQMASPLSFFSISSSLSLPPRSICRVVCRLCL